MKSKITLFVVVLFCQITFGQATGEKLIHGKIIVESGNVAGVNVINLVNEKSTISDNNGYFFILAKTDDLLVFSAENLEYHRKEIEEKDLKTAILTIKMISKVTELKEVIVNKHPEINAVALGISPKGIIQRTQAERRLYTAKSTPVIALINSISGRTAMLKKELEVEKKELLLVKVDALFEEDYYVKTLKIPSEYIKGFQYYIVENESFASVVNSKNKTKINFLMVELAEEYNKIISSEK